MEEIRGITWDLWGAELSHEQTIQRIINAGFPIKGGVALTMFAIVEGESGEYQQAWHANVERWNDENKTIKRFEQQPDLSFRAVPLGAPEPALTFMFMKSIDLGFMQINKPVNEFVEMGAEACEDFVLGQFEKYPRLSSPVTSCEDALVIWKARGFWPWYAYQPGTEKFRLKKRYGAKAFADWLIHSFVGPDPETGRLPRLVWADQK
ncbi:MAG TPA: hypothetical protein VLA89_06505 [Gemmatimonadales bacterium]|nr:hypothetical protein [Gemmatimonadales bacterium]